MSATTVKIHRITKNALDEMKKENESYDNLIGKLITRAKNGEIRNELIEGYKKTGKKDLKVLEEWESASREV